MLLVLVPGSTATVTFTALTLLAAMETANHHNALGYLHIPVLQTPHPSVAKTAHQRCKHHTPVLQTLHTSVANTAHQCCKHHTPVLQTSHTSVANTTYQCCKHHSRNTILNSTSTISSDDCDLHSTTHRQQQACSDTIAGDLAWIVVAPSHCDPYACYNQALQV
jgi:hypothetical protein